MSSHFPGKVLSRVGDTTERFISHKRERHVVFVPCAVAEMSVGVVNALEVILGAIHYGAGGNLENRDLLRLR